MNDYSEHFYSTSLATKIARLTLMVDNTETVDLTSLANELSDGCGGCEQLFQGDITDHSFGTLVSVLWSEGGFGRYALTTYVRVDTDSHSNVENISISRTEVPSREGMTEDSMRAYLDVLQHGNWEELGTE